MSYSFEWIGAPLAMGVVVFLCVPPFALLALTLLVIVAAWLVVALLAASVTVAPYVLARHLHRRRLSWSAARDVSAPPRAEAELVLAP